MTSKALRSFDPVKLARFERDNWAAYYHKRWFSLLRISVGMVREAFGLSLWQGLYSAYLVARAEIAAAPADNDIALAERFMTRFYEFIRRIHREEFDPEQAARLEVKWWVVHRRLFGRTDNQELVEALEDLYGALYGLEPEHVHPAAFHRAQAMVHSDRWVLEGRPANSPLLGLVEQELVTSYGALQRVVAQR